MIRYMVRSLQALDWLSLVELRLAKETTFCITSYICRVN